MNLLWEKKEPTISLESFQFSHATIFGYDSSLLGAPNWVKGLSPKQLDDMKAWIQTCKQPSYKDLLKEDAPYWLKLTGAPFLQAARELIEKLRISIVPHKRGSTGTPTEISTSIQDADMEKFKSICPFEMVEVEKLYRAFPKPKKAVRVFTWQSDDDKEVLQFLNSWKIEKFAKEENYFHHIYSERDNATVPIDPVRYENELLTVLKYETMEKENWGDNYKNVEIIGTTIMLGEYRPAGTVISEREAKGKKRKRVTVGRFKIIYVPNLFPKSGAGILRFKCTYYTDKDGLRWGN